MTKVLNIIKPLNTHTGTVIFLHGSGGTGADTEAWIRMLKRDIAFPHIKLIFPTAPLRPYIPLGGELSNVWFNRIDITPDSVDHLETINEAGDDLKKIVQQEIDAGISIDRIVIGGFSMGGGMAMQMGYRILPGIAGVFALSSFLSRSSTIYKELERNKLDKLPALFYAHGDKDDLVDLSWGQETFKRLLQFGVEGNFVVLKDTYHELKRSEINSLWNWINEIVPEKC